MQYLIFVLIILMTSFTSCRNKPIQEEYSTSSNSHINIIIEESIAESRNFKLSEIVEEIEYIPLETKTECLIGPGYYVIGKKVMIFTGTNPSHILLFNNHGKFIREIGKRGNGPGEYRSPGPVDLSKEENKIIFCAPFRPSLMEYNIDGSFIQKFNIGSPIEMGPYYLDDNNIVVMQARPYQDSLNFPRIILINLQTKKHRTLLAIDHKRINNPEANIPCNNALFKTSTGIYFRDCTMNTLYRITQDRLVEPAVSFSLDNNILPDYIYSEISRPRSQIFSINILSNRIFIHGDYRGRFHLVYDMNSETSFRLIKLKDCKGLTNYSYGIQNDIDGLMPFWNFNPVYERDNTIASVIEVAELQELIELECFVSEIAKKNPFSMKLNKILKGKTNSDNPVVRILHLIPQEVNSSQ